MMIASCKKENKFQEVTFPKVTVAISSVNGQIVVPTANNYSKPPGKLEVPIRISLSGVAPQLLAVNIGVNNDTINQLIASNALPNAVLLPPTDYSFPGKVEIRYGIDTGSFVLLVNMTTIEKYYGKNLAVAFTLSNPTKNNTLDSAKKTAIVMINTSQIITPQEIHYVYFTNAGSQLMVSNDTTYSLNPTVPYNAGTITVPVSVSLGASAGSAFSATLTANPDTVQSLINNQTLANTVLLGNTDYSLPSTVNFDGGKNIATFNVKVNLSALIANAGKKIALGINLSAPTSHLLDSTRDNQVVVIDPSKILETDITNKNSIFSVQYDNTNPNDQGENSPHLVDNSLSTKFLIFGFVTPAWCQLLFPVQETVEAYTITSANDTPTRDPKDWQLLGSNDGSSWTVLDTRTNEFFGGRFETHRYVVASPGAYLYYRWNITANAGNSLFQCAEWRMFTKP